MLEGMLEVPSRGTKGTFCERIYSQGNLTLIW
jgi:hypothetical protein